MAQPEQVPLTLQEGYIQGCQGYLDRKTSILKRWKKRWISVEPGEIDKSLNRCLETIQACGL